MTKAEFEIGENSEQQLNQLPKNTVSWVEIFEFSCILINRLLIGFLTIYVMWTCLRAEEIPWHAILCTIGFVFVISEGLIAHYRGNAISRVCYRTEKTRLHWILQTSALILGLTGILFKCTLETKHFYTLHGQLGLATLIMLLISSSTGLTALYANCLAAYYRPLVNKTLHTLLGLTTYALVIASIFTAFDTHIFLEYSADAHNYADFRILIKTATVLIFVLTILGPLCALIYSKIWN